MKQIPAKFWNAIGWVGLLLTAWSFVLATIDGVMAIFMFPIAMLVGGVSGLGATSTARFGIATIVLCTALVFRITLYDTLAFVGIPLTVSGGMLMWGMNVRRKKAIGCANPKGVKRSGFGRSETIATEKLERRLSVGAVVQI